MNLLFKDNTLQQPKQTRGAALLLPAVQYRFRSQPARGILGMYI
jgi:hypothetical protein